MRRTAGERRPGQASQSVKGLGSANGKHQRRPFAGIARLDGSATRADTAARAGLADFSASRNKARRRAKDQ
jgi:hypothetical protein